MTDTLQLRLGSLKLVGFDVDGVFTDGLLYLSDDGSESKSFNTQDGYGVRALLDAGIEVAVISGRKSAAVQRRMKELGVKHVFLGCRDKRVAFDGLLEELNMQASDCAWVGDDVPDRVLLRAAGIGIGVANVHPSLLPDCDWVTERAGGAGAVREVCDRILEARGYREE